MKKFVFYLAFLFGIVSLSSAEEENEIRELKPFDQIDVSRGVEVVLTQTEEHNALIISEYYAMEEVITEVDGTTLKISMAKNNTGDVNVEVRLSFTKLRQITVKGNAIVRATHPLNLENIEIKGNTGGLVELKLNSDIVRLSAGEGTVIRAEGKCNSLDAKCATGSTIYADKLKATDVFAKAGISSKLFVAAEKSIDAKASSGGLITVSGNPSNVVKASTFGGKVQMKDILDAKEAEEKLDSLPTS